MGVAGIVHFAADRLSEVDSEQRILCGKFDTREQNNPNPQN